MAQVSACPDADVLNALAQRVERGELPALDEINPLTRSGDRQVRGQAKRLLSYVLVRQARSTAATLLIDACTDLDFRAPVVLHEAVQQAAGLEQWPAVVALCLRAAERLAAHEAHVPALVYLQNAVVTDIGHGSNNVNDPRFLRRVIATYERLAQQTQSLAGVRPGPRGRRRSPAGGPLRMAHVVAQLVDGGHAPSRSLETMLKFADRERFQTCLCITESLARHAEHAGQLLASETSDRRAPQRIGRFEEDYGIPVIRPRSRQSFVTAAADLHAQLAARQIDVAFFHGSAATPTEWLLCAWQAAPWQADAGFGVPLHCPALDYQFFEFEETMEALAFMCRERGIPYGFKNSGADLSHIEEVVPLSRAELQVPDDHVILGTVGNHLPKRMSAEFCRTVADVMRAHPRTTLLVVGPGDFRTQRAALGDDLCNGSSGQPRARFLGHMSEPARATKAFDVYLNSYPDGGGFVLGDAMAAARPIVCMVASDSTYARAGQTWVGEEHLVQPATSAAYAARLAQLIADPAEREALGRRMRQRYEERFDARRWVAHMTDRIWEVVNGASAVKA
jgi:glycosyltransferase involved in cell wall biosynthesis